jgi:hypothetical protein
MTRPSTTLIVRVNSRGGDLLGCLAAGLARPGDDHLLHPEPVDVLVEGDEVSIQFPKESNVAQTEAKRLAEKAGKRAAEGNYEKAIGILKRVLELQPSLALPTHGPA